MTVDESLNPMENHVGVPKSTNLRGLRYCLYRPSRLVQNAIYLIGSILHSAGTRSTVHTAILIHHPRRHVLASWILDGLVRYDYMLVLRKHMRKLDFLAGTL